MKQERLVAPVTAEHRYILRENLPTISELNCTKPDAAFVASVAAQQLQPVSLVEHGDGYEVVFGNRRIYACHLAELDGLTAYVYQPGDINRGLAIVSENHHRRPNPFSDYDAIVPMLNSHTIEEVAAQLHLPVPVVKAAMKLEKLLPTLLSLARQGDLAKSTALSLASKPRVVQEKVLAKIEAGEKVTGDLVRECMYAAINEASPILPIPDLPGAPGLQFGTAFDTPKGVKLTFWHEGVVKQFTVPAQKLYEFVQA